MNSPQPFILSRYSGGPLSHENHIEIALMVFSSDISRVVEWGADVLIISPLQQGGIPFTTLGISTITSWSKMRPLGTWGAASYSAEFNQVFDCANKRLFSSYHASAYLVEVTTSDYTQFRLVIDNDWIRPLSLITMRTRGFDLD